MKEKGVFWVLALVVFTGACGRGEPESDGMIAEVNGRIEVIRDPVRQQEVCTFQYCEPNYLVFSSFGRRRHSAPPAPAPTPPPQEKAPPPVPDLTELPDEIFDHAKEIMRVADAWKVTSGSPEIVVAVIDSGIELDHPDLQDNLWTNPGEKGGAPGRDLDGNGYAYDLHGYDFLGRNSEPRDDNGHGTHTAGTMAAVKNGFGVVGIAPNVKIMPLRFLGAGGQGSTANAIEAIRYAVKMGARVISASWGGSGYSSLLAQAVSDARRAGVVFVAAAGNEGKDLSSAPVYPASLEGVIAVAASDSSDELARFSNYGASVVPIAAPGVGILSTYPGKGYKTLSGTSMATPQVAGAIALALGISSSVTPDKIEAHLCRTADPIRNPGVRCGRINVGRLIQSIGMP